MQASRQQIPNIDFKLLEGVRVPNPKPAIQVKKEIFEDYQMQQQQQQRDQFSHSNYQPQQNYPPPQERYQPPQERYQPPQQSYQQPPQQNYQQPPQQSYQPPPAPEPKKILVSNLINQRAKIIKHLNKETIVAESPDQSWKCLIFHDHIMNPRPVTNLFDFFPIKANVTLNANLIGSDKSIQYISTLAWDPDILPNPGNTVMMQRMVTDNHMMKFYDALNSFVVMGKVQDTASRLNDKLSQGSYGQGQPSMNPAMNQVLDTASKLKEKIETGPTEFYCKKVLMSDMLSFIFKRFILAYLFKSSQIFLKAFCAEILN